MHKNYTKKPIGSELTKSDTDFIKGIAIILIVLHNYFHWQEGLSIENEFFFNDENFKKYISGINGGITDFFRYTMAYFGHLGVQIFIFSSGYSLYKEAVHKSNLSFIHYYSNKIKKLSILLFLGMVFAYTIRYITHGTLINPFIFIDYFIFILTSHSNFDSRTIFVVSGPFWFFGLMTQLYLIFPLLKIILDRLNFNSICLFIALSLITISIAHPIALSKNYFVNANFIGNIPVFIFGMLYAKYFFKLYLPITIILSVTFLYIQNIYWTFNIWALMFTYIFISLYISARSSTILNIRYKKYFTQSVKYIGSISMAIFIINGPLRNLSLFKENQYYMASEKIFLFLIILIAISIPFAKIYEISRRLIDRLTKTNHHKNLYKS